MTTVVLILMILYVAGGAYWFVPLGKQHYAQKVRYRCHKAESLAEIIARPSICRRDHDPHCWRPDPVARTPQDGTRIAAKALAWPVTMWGPLAAKVVPESDAESDARYRAIEAEALAPWDDDAPEAERLAIWSDQPPHWSGRANNRFEYNNKEHPVEIWIRLDDIVPARGTFTFTCSSPLSIWVRKAD